MRSIAWSRSSTPEIAKKHVCSTVFVRPRQAGRAGDPAGVDHVEPDVLLEHAPLDLAHELVPNAAGRVVRVEQQRGAGRRAVEHLGPLQQPELVAADEARAGDEVRRANRLRAETQVRDRLRT